MKQESDRDLQPDRRCGCWYKKHQTHRRITALMLDNESDERNNQKNCNGYSEHDVIAVSVHDVLVRTWRIKMQ